MAAALVAARPLGQRIGGSAPDPGPGQRPLRFLRPGQVQRERQPDPGRKVQLGLYIISDCQFAAQLDHFIPGFLSYLVAVFLK